MTSNGHISTHREQNIKHIMTPCLKFDRRPRNNAAYQSSNSYDILKGSRLFIDRYIGKTNDAVIRIRYNSV